MRISDWSSDVCSSDLLASGFHTLDRGTNLLDGGVPYYGVFETADRQYVSIGALEPQFFARLVDILGLDPEWKAARIDKVRWPELKALLDATFRAHDSAHRSAEQTSELQSLMRISYAVFCCNKKQVITT